MSYPKKAKGWRSLVIDSQRFRWRFVAKIENSLLKLQGSSSTGQQAIVTLREWHDPWHFIGYPVALMNEPKVVTAKFASQAIGSALQNGWNPEEPGAPVHFEYKDSNFVLL